MLLKSIIVVAEIGRKFNLSCADEMRLSLVNFAVEILYTRGKQFLWFGLSFVSINKTHNE